MNDEKKNPPRGARGVPTALGPWYNIAEEVKKVGDLGSGGFQGFRPGVSRGE